MDTQIGKGLDGLANVVAKKWYAAMGLLGMILFVSALVVDIPTDRIAVICVGLIMMGFGFGNTECRTFRTGIGHGFTITGPAWKWTFTGAMMFLIGTGAAIYLGYHLITSGAA
ncbi:hypothetical protein TG4357_02672 [Thalassovita gelatinovora]|uniref:Uncharacterized protein n=1 Tax=Thalassovita gelatinovora TaxID=53501 RepID=A0A0P1FFH1_THAGE|nr:hypothetical protein [Thalassovita gelatinovora]QIZ79797.1 hypothetical protein HFZ77_04525 [Thalassovita gelatinovora]CUH66841.1 hypothetical protein TG4357_02672 [Thalassovita gelatinovora]SEQ43748.1 hypothetical protein SAMN04488043_105209 [Thalassovita gelatinovora]